MRRLTPLLLMVLVLAACAAGPNAFHGVPDAQGIVAGFWRGLWHGLIAPVAFVVSLFSSKVAVYEVHNDGAFYNLGFLLGLSVSIGGGSNGHKLRRRR